MAKYHIGDRVVVDPEIIDKQEAGLYNIYATATMVDYAGQIVTISMVFYGDDDDDITVYQTEETNDFGWDERMFIGLAETETTADISEKDFLEVLQYGF